jgi:hypothetical protein
LAAKSELQQQAMQLTGIAEELKAAAGKTKKFELSLAVIRKANEVERLSHHMQATAVKK